MKAYYFLLFLSLGFLTIGACKKPDGAATPLPFASVPAVFPVSAAAPAEISGIACSEINLGYIWGHEDGGHAPELSLISYTGNFLKKVYVKGAINRDWEDMQISTGPTPGKAYLYIGELGDNNGVENRYTIYRFPEPELKEDTVFDFQKINFTYEDGAHDVEAFLVDRMSRDIYLITKRDVPARIYKIAYTQDEHVIQQAKQVGELKFSGVTAAAISPHNDEIIVKTYAQVFYWRRNRNETIETVLRRDALQLPYTAEPQGEAVCFKSDASGFFTLSERPFGAPLSLYFYKRN